MGMSIKKAVIYNSIGTYANALTQLVINMILARLISPSEMGVVAIISVFTNLFVILSDMGLSTGIIQKKNLTKRDINNIASFTIYLGIALAIFFVLISRFVAVIYGNPIYINFSYILIFSIFFNTINSVPKAILARDKKFDLIAKRTIFANILCGVIVVVLAFLGFGSYVLVINSVLISLILFTLNYYKSNIKFSLMFEKESIIKIANYSFFQFLSSIITFGSRNSDNMLIGYTLGEVPVAFYDKAYQLMKYPLNLFYNAISSVLHPYFSAIQDDEESMLKQYSLILKILSIGGVIMTVVSFTFPKEIILIMFGANWLDSAIPFQMLAVGLWAQMVSSSTSSIIQSFGKTKLLFYATIFNIVITITLLLLGLKSNDIIPISFLMSISFWIIAASSFWMISTLCFTKKGEYFLKFLFADASYVIVNVIIVFLFIQDSSFGLRCIYVVLSAFIYMFVLKNYTYIKTIIEKK